MAASKITSFMYIIHYTSIQQYIQTPGRLPDEFGKIYILQITAKSDRICSHNFETRINLGVFSAVFFCVLLLFPVSLP